MYYFKYPYIIYRDYPDYGYLTDNRNFGYDTASKSSLKFGDRIISKTGSIFYSVLTEMPRSLCEIVNDLCEIFTDVSPTDIEHDVDVFFSRLSEDGFIGKVSDYNELTSNVIFSYDCKIPYELDNVASILDKRSTLKVWNDDCHLTRVHVNVSGPCNEHCVHCYFPVEYRKKTMSRKQFLTLIEQCKECNVLNITLSGGEPMLNPELCFFIDKCRENNFSINVLSNLTLLSDELVEKFITTPLLSVQTSLYSMDANVHDSITKVNGSFDKTKQAIEILWKHNVPLQINCPIMKQNLDTYHDVLGWARSLNIEANSDYMLFGRFDGTASNLDSRLDLLEVKTLFENDRELYLGKKIASAESGMELQKCSVCPVCMHSLCVSYNGDVYPCEGWQKMNLGNINDTSLFQLWTESKVVCGLRNLTLEGDFPQCVVCENREYCSICLIRNANESSKGDFKEINPYFCEIAKMKRIMSNN